MHPSTFVYIPKGSSGAHGEHARAITLYAGGSAELLVSFFAACCRIFFCRIFFIQKTHPLNLMLLLLCKAFGVKSLLYVHEPLTYQQRTRKGVPRWKSMILVAFQFIESKLASMLLTGNVENREFFGKPMAYAPLLFEEFDFGGRSWRHRSGNILYFGRIDSEKFFEEFCRLGISKKILATQNLNIKNYSGIVEQVSEQMKAEFFSSGKFVWCVQRNALTQSGVVLDALRYGCIPLLAKGDPIARSVGADFCIEVPKYFNDSVVVGVIGDYMRAHPDGVDSAGLKEVFSRLAGDECFKKYWKRYLCVD